MESGGGAVKVPKRVSSRKVGTGEELAEPGHPDAPDAGPEVHAGIALGEAQ
jgi:hypothetical protein